MGAGDDASCVSASINNTLQKGDRRSQGRILCKTTFLFNRWAHDPVERLYFAGFPAGCVTNLLMCCPDNGGTRTEIGVFLERAREGSSYVPLDH
jgi:hypothetical protein